MRRVAVDVLPNAVTGYGPVSDQLGEDAAPPQSGVDDPVDAGEDAPPHTGVGAGVIKSGTGRVTHRLPRVACWGKARVAGPSLLRPAGIHPKYRVNAEDRAALCDQFFRQTRW